MLRLWTIIGVRDVHTSFAWYLHLLGLPPASPAHDHFGQVCDTDGTVLLCVHAWGEHDHASLIAPEPAPGNGLLLFFRVSDFAAAVKRARQAGPLDTEPELNPSTGTLEFTVRDPDGYYVMISAQTVLPP